MAYFDWTPLGFLSHAGKTVYHTYTPRKKGTQQSLMENIYSTDKDADPNGEFAFDIRDIENLYGLDPKDILYQMKLIACAIEKGKIKFPEWQLQQKVDLTDPWIRYNRQPILDLLAQEK